MRIGPEDLWHIMHQIIFGRFDESVQNAIKLKKIFTKDDIGAVQGAELPSDAKVIFFRPDYNSQIAASIWVPIYYLSLQRQKKMEHLMLVGLGRVRNFMRQVKVWYFHFRMSQVSKKIRVFSVSRVESGNKFSSYESGQSPTQPPSY